MQLTAHPLTPDAPEIVPAPRARKWLKSNANPNRCLPLTIANQSGWWVLNPAPFIAFCEVDTGVVQIEYEKGWKVPLFPAKHHFGHGVMTYDLPFIWQTEPGWNLHVRGPANYPLLGAYCLEGIFEADWAKIPVPSNWQLEPGRYIHFPKDFPIAQIAPVPRRALEEFEPKVEFSQQAIDNASEYYAFRGEEFALKEGTRPLRGYFKGESPTGEEFQDHQVNVTLSSFS